MLSYSSTPGVCGGVGTIGDLSSVALAKENVGVVIPHTRATWKGAQAIPLLL
jgi:hypothetical protein